jgi:hypothetical protein
MQILPNARRAVVFLAIVGLFVAPLRANASLTFAADNSSQSKNIGDAGNVIWQKRNPAIQSKLTPPPRLPAFAQADRA